jgi:hypothetical protein
MDADLCDSFDSSQNMLRFEPNDSFDPKPSSSPRDHINTNKNTKQAPHLLS